MRLNSRGYSLIELIILSGVMLAVSTSMYLGISQANKQNETVRGMYDYRNLVDVAKDSLKMSGSCQLTFGTNETYTGAAKTFPQIAVAGVVYTPGTRFANSAISLQNVRISAETAPSQAMSFTVGGVTTNYRHRRANITIAVQRGNFSYKPIAFPVSMYVAAANNRILLCAADDQAQHCYQSGGIVKLDASGNPKCDILPAIGGCAKGGTYTRQDTACAVGNPYTGSCSCPTGFTAYTIGNFSLSKDATMIQSECLFCSGGVTPATSVILTPVFNQSQIENDLNCTANLSLCQACQTDPASQTCICGRDPSDPACTTPSACTTYGAGSCPCLAEQQTIACTANPSSTACTTASGAYYAACVTF